MLFYIVSLFPFLTLYYALHWIQKEKKFQESISYIYTIMITLFALFLFNTVNDLILRDQHSESMIWLSLLMVVVSCIGILVYIPPIRKWINHFMPIKPHDPIHTVSLSLSMLIFIQYLFSLQNQTADLATEPPSFITAMELWLQNLMYFLFALIGVGWLVKRPLKETFFRLGLVKPTWRTVLLGIAIGLLFNVFVISLQYIGLNPDPTIEESANQHLEPLFQNALGLLTLSLAPAIGEEVLFRGALLPRFGLIYTSLLFTCVHSQYGFTYLTLNVFLLALGLGWLRKRYSTTLTIIAHASYNLILGILISFT